MGQSGKEQRCSSHTKHEDRLSMLTDDILLSILGRVDITTATRTSVLSKRWRDLPRLLPVLNLRVRDFLPYPYPEPIAAHHVDQAMSRLTKATRSFLAEPSSKSTVIKRLSLQLYVTGDYAHEIGPLARDAIDCGVVKKLYLAIVDEKELRDCEHEDMLQQARAVVRFITAYPCVFQCLTKLHLYNVRFPEWDIHYLLFDSCKQLKQLFLCHCDVGDSSVWQINAPNSKLRILKVRMSCLKRIEVLCLPKLKHLHWDEWFCFEAPLRFGFVPSLKGLGLICGATVDHQEFSLSQVLHGTRDIHTLTLDFQGERLWIHPEGKQLCSAFKKLRKLSIGGIFVDFDLLWTINLLEAAPSVEIFSVRIWDHACQDDEQLRTTTGYEAQRTKPSWSMPKFTSSETWQLRELEFVGFRPLEQQISFLRSVMERAPNLKTVLLKEDNDPCEDCDSMNVPRGGFCPTDKGEQEIIIKQLRDGIRSTARIIFPNGGYS